MELKHINIKDLFERKCINARPAINRYGGQVLYRHPDLYQWAKDSYEKGEKYFYISYPNPNNPHHIVLSKPEYRWFLKNRDGLTDEEFKELCDEKII